MIVKTLRINSKLEGLITNCYIIIDEESHKAIVIDPAAEHEKIIEELKKTNVSLEYIILTHCHVDHICAVNELVAELGGKVLASKIESKRINNEKVSLTFLGNVKYSNIIISKELEDNEEILLGKNKIKIIYTPGHTEGSISIYLEKDNALFTGDTLFKDTYGRTDLPTGSEYDILKSIKEKILVLPENTIIYPGHGIETIIKNEKINFKA